MSPSGAGAANPNAQIQTCVCQRRCLRTGTALRHGAPIAWGTYNDIPVITTTKIPDTRVVLLENCGAHREVWERMLPPAAQPTPPAQPVHVTPHDIGSMLLWSLRYAMGRRSTAPDDVAECVRRYWSLSDDSHRWFMFRDLRREFERAFLCGDHARLGDRCDVETWAGLLFWMRDRVPV